MTIISNILNFVAILLTLAMTISMLLIFRRARPINYLSPLISILVCLEILFFFIVLSGSRFNLWLSGFFLLTGSLIGLIRGVIITLHYQKGQVVGKMPLFFLFCWGISLVIAQSSNVFGSSLLSSLGLIPLIFTTGTQAGISGGIFLRRMVIRSPTRSIQVS